MPHRIRGYVHDPKEEGGPYIAVVLAPDAAPAVTLHASYAEAERELERRLADLKQTSLAHHARAAMKAKGVDCSRLAILTGMRPEHR